uniref:Uncharacterized protein n=1 Tax=Arundo donax TaxID=35708 RepID=A0A0A8ZUE0_ARUDO
MCTQLYFCLSVNNSLCIGFRRSLKRLVLYLDRDDYLDYHCTCF